MTSFKIGSDPRFNFSILDSIIAFWKEFRSSETESKCCNWGSLWVVRCIIFRRDDLEPLKPDSQLHMPMQKEAVPGRLWIQEKGQEVSCQGFCSVCPLLATA